MRWHTSAECSDFAAAGFSERNDLQRLLRDRIEILSPDTLVIAEEFSHWDDSKRRIDLLGVDRDAKLVVIELKRTEDGGHMELQALRYAAMVSTMTIAVEAESPPRNATSAKNWLPALTGSASTKLSPSAPGGSRMRPAMAIGMTKMLMAMR